MDLAGGPIELFESNLNQVLDATPLSLFVAQGGKLVYANARFLATAGLPLDKLIGMDVSGLVPDPHMREQARERMRLAEEGERQPPIVYQVQLRDGRWIWARTESTQCLFHGQPASLTMAFDITADVETTHALRDSEERYC